MRVLKVSTLLNILSESFRFIIIKLETLLVLLSLFIFYNNQVVQIVKLHNYKYGNNVVGTLWLFISFMRCILVVLACICWTLERFSFTVGSNMCKSSNKLINNKGNTNNMQEYTCIYIYIYIKII